MLNKKKNNKGFTLVELLVVIAIIGILAVVAVPALFSNINKAKIADLEADYSAMKSAALSYYSDTNDYSPITSPGVLSEYMESVPANDPFGGDYTIEADVKDQGKLVLVASLGKKSLVGTKELIKLQKDLGDAVVNPTETGIRLVLIK